MILRRNLIGKACGILVISVMVMTASITMFSREVNAATCYAVLPCVGLCTTGTCAPRVVSSSLTMIGTTVCVDSSFVGSAASCGVCIKFLIPRGSCGGPSLDACV